MDAAHLEPLPLFSTIGLAERWAVDKALKSPLSGYLGGVSTAGYWIERLQYEWCDTFKCKYAVACNSATSGLLAACMAIGIGPGDTVWTSAYTMSATAACAKVLGADIAFIDIETMRYSMNMNLLRGPMPKCIIVTNLFGHPAYLGAMRTWCNSNKVIMIEDNAQSPFATEGGKYAGTVGHIGVFSLNVHKHIQCGEGGVVVTDEESYGSRLVEAINHGELAGGISGLNLRMTEPIAAIAVAQLAKGPQIIESRRELAQQLIEMFRCHWIIPPVEDIDCKHVYYLWVARVEDSKRKNLVRSLVSHGFPIRERYSIPLHRLFYISKRIHSGIPNVTLPVVEKMEDEELIAFEVCRYDPTKKQRLKMAEIVKRVVNENS